jgi:MscS family membrane protein
VKEDVLLKVMDIIGFRGAEVAFPTSTIHVPGGVRMHAEQEPQADLARS